MPYRPKDPEKYRDEEWLRDQYHGERLSAGDIADKCDCAKSTILRWLDRHGIEKRDRSEAAEIRAERYPHTTEAGAEALKEHGVNAWEYWDDEQREAFRERLSKQRTGDNNPMAGKTGPDHHNWEPDKAPHRFYSSKKWKETREEVLERDDHECQVCGKTKEENGRALDVHHRTPLREFKREGGELDYETAHNLDNLITLCRSCHREYEGLPVVPRAAD